LANLTFIDLLNETYAQTGLDSNDSNVQTNVKRWVNYTQQDLLARWPWTFMEARETVVTVKDYTAGTVSVNTGSGTVTGTGTTFTSTHANLQYFIQFSGANDWYQITSYISATQITITPGYQPTTNATNVTYIIRAFFYSLSATADRIIDIRNWNTPLKIIEVDPRQLDDLMPNPQSTGSSYGYLCWGYDSSGNIQVTPYPFPSDARLLEVRVNKRPTDMSANGDLPAVPNKYAHILAWGAIAIGFNYLRKKEDAGFWSAKYENRISEMKREYRLSEDNQPILKSIDSVQRAKWIAMPQQFPVITSG